MFHKKSVFTLLIALQRLSYYLHLPLACPVNLLLQPMSAITLIPLHGTLHLPLRSHLKILYKLPHPTSLKQTLPLTKGRSMILKMRCGKIFWRRPLMMHVSLLNSLIACFEMHSNGWIAYFALTNYVPDGAQEAFEPPAERLLCVACQGPILALTIDIGHHPILWHLARCHHPLHLDCLTPLGQPYAVSGVTHRPRYIHDPGLSNCAFFPCINYTNFGNLSCHTNPKTAT